MKAIEYTIGIYMTNDEGLNGKINITLPKPPEKPIDASKVDLPTLLTSFNRPAMGDRWRFMTDEEVEEYKAEEAPPHDR